MKETAALLDWYDISGRDLPFRHKGGAHPDPYTVWLSEMMLQQTTIKTVIPYLERFKIKFPDIKSLARAKEEEVLFLWQGLGYYSRARNVLKCAKKIMEIHGGKFPKEKDQLIKLPGIGPYTAGAIRALAFNEPEMVVDGNVIRVLTRYFGMEQEIKSIQKDIEQKATALVSKDRAADYTSAIMDLGATVCTPKSPKCLDCPWQKGCRALKEGKIESIPKIEKPKKEKRIGIVYIIEKNKKILFQKSKDGLFKGMDILPYEFVSTENPKSKIKNQKFVKHVFTHFDLTLLIENKKYEGEEGMWIEKSKIKTLSLPTLMKKVLKRMEEKE